MKRFIFCLLSLLCMLAVQAQVTRLDKASYPNTYVLCEHIDVGQVVQAINVYTPISPVTNTYCVTSNNYATNAVYCTSVTPVIYTSSISVYQRGVGLINTYSYINNLTQSTIGYTSNTPYRNVERYYCYQH